MAHPGARQWRCDSLPGDAAAFHAGLPGYAPTPLVESPALATGLGVGRVFVKDESSRLGLPAFKVLGVSWGAVRALANHLGLDRPPASLDAMRVALAGQRFELVTASDGNHGRALARIAALLGLAAHVVLPDVVNPKAITAVEAEGATVTIIGGSYDDAVGHAATRAAASPHRLLVQDTAWPGYETIPGWIVEGYATLFIEADRQLAEAAVDAPHLVVVPTGAGSLLQAALAHYRAAGRADAPAVLSVEPGNAACALAALEAGEVTSVPTGETVMAGLNCGTLSLLAWPFVANGLDAAVTVTDEAARVAMTDLAAAGVPAGPCGAAALAGVRAALEDPARRDALAVTDRSVLLLISTEGVASGAA